MEALGLFFFSPMEGRIASCGTERRTRLQTAGVLLAKRPEDCVNLLNDSGFKRLFFSRSY